eukprot:12025105-Alexandrium_andersonii.AAC.1
MPGGQLDVLAAGSAPPRWLPGRQSRFDQAEGADSDTLDKPATCGREHERRLALRPRVVPFLRNPDQELR